MISFNLKQLSANGPDRSNFFLSLNSYRLVSSNLQKEPADKIFSQILQHKSSIRTKVTFCHINHN